MFKKRLNADHVGDGLASNVTPSVSVSPVVGPVCCVCGAKENIKRCGKCKATSYCSKGCQVAHLSYHGVYCEAISDLHKLETGKLYRDFSVRQSQMDLKIKTRMMKLIGEKPKLRCQLDGKEVEFLWDTGSMVSMVDRAWVDQHFPDKQIYSVADFLQTDLNVRAANSSEILYDGVVVLNLTLEDGKEGFLVPILVASREISEPILGYND